MRTTELRIYQNTNTNVHIVGIPERAGEGRDPTVFMEKWLLELFCKDALSPFFAMERAYHVLARPPLPGGPSRPILEWLLHYCDQEAVLRHARDHANIQFNLTRVSFYPDFSAEVQRCRTKFIEVKKCLRHLQLSYAMLYLAKLRVMMRDQAYFFESAKEASALLDWNEQAPHHCWDEDDGDWSLTPTFPAW